MAKTTDVLTEKKTLTQPEYVTSSDTLAYKNSLAGVENSQPTFNSEYDNLYKNAMAAAANREDFSYDFNADPLYQQYKDQYTSQGKVAANNAAAAASTLTGGYGNSYATTAAAQANQEYLTQLNNVIPELYNAALNKYNTETENLYRNVDMYGSAYDREYNQYANELSQWNTNRDYYAGRVDSSTANDQWNYSKDYNSYRDDVSDSQWQQSLNYQKEQDQIANDLNQAQYDLSYEQWLWEKKMQEEQLALSKQKAATSGSSRSSSSKKSSSKSSTDDIAADTTTTTTEKATATGASAADMKNYKAIVMQKHQMNGNATEFIESLKKNGKLTEKQYDTLMAMIS